MVRGSAYFIATLRACVRVCVCLQSTSGMDEFGRPLRPQASPHARDDERAVRPAGVGDERRASRFERPHDAAPPYAHASVHRDDQFDARGYARDERRGTWRDDERPPYRGGSDAREDGARRASGREEDSRVAGAHQGDERGDRYSGGYRGAPPHDRFVDSRHAGGRDGPRDAPGAARDERSAWHGRPDERGSDRGGGRGSPYAGGAPYGGSTHGGGYDASRSGERGGGDFGSRPRPPYARGGGGGGGGGGGPPSTAFLEARAAERERLPVPWIWG
ncbi:hypothetical protein EON67_01150, partial [archaeon]